jgi:hypothetical protein
MKDHVDISMGIVTLIVEDLVTINPTEEIRHPRRGDDKKFLCVYYNG